MQLLYRLGGRGERVECAVMPRLIFSTRYFEQEMSPLQHSMRMSVSWPVVARCLRPLPPPGTSRPQMKMAGTCKKKMGDD
jgi:hypothetical protein